MIIRMEGLNHKQKMHYIMKEPLSQFDEIAVRQMPPSNYDAGRFLVFKKAINSNTYGHIEFNGTARDISLNGDYSIKFELSSDELMILTACMFEGFPVEGVLDKFSEALAEIRSARCEGLQDSNAFLAADGGGETNG